jgi:RNA polymerase sigma factor (TIGR02999 family)
MARSGQSFRVVFRTVSPGVRRALRALAPTRYTGWIGPMTTTPADITLLLHAAASGSREDLDALMSAIYHDMRRLAASHLGSERPDHTLQPTALVHEAYVKLIDQRTTDWKDRLHFFAVASRIIRRILIDHARARLADKRGGDRTLVSLADHDPAAPSSGAPSVDLLALDEALDELARLDEQQARIVELRYFGGCSIEEIAQVLEIGKRTVDRDWQAARAWLFLRLADDAPPRAEPTHAR